MGRLRRATRRVGWMDWPNPHLPTGCLFVPGCRHPRVDLGPYCAFHSRGFRVRLSSIRGAGRGLFTTRPLRSGQFVGFYRGELLSTERLQQRYGDGLAPYVFNTEYPDVFVDGVRPDSGLERFINDGLSAHAPNVRAVGVGALIILRAVAPVSAGEELFLHYGRSYWTRE